MTFAPRTHDLHGIPATLFLTLAARALAPIEAPELGLADHKAEQILARLEIDPRQFALNANEVRAVVLRSQWFAQTTRSFFERYPEGLCINVGCGLKYVAAVGLRPANYPRLHDNLGVIIVAQSEDAGCGRRVQFQQHRLDMELRP